MYWKYIEVETSAPEPEHDFRRQGEVFKHALANSGQRPPTITKILRAFAFQPLASLPVSRKIYHRFIQYIVLAAAYSPLSSTIGSRGLDFRVRNGNGYYPTDKPPKQCIQCVTRCGRSTKRTLRCIVVDTSMHRSISQYI